MTQEQIRRAVQYNRSEGFSQDEVKLIQRTVGSDADGLWGPDTVQAVWRWQARNGVPADGKVWRNDAGNTWPLLKEAAAHQMPPLRVGLWIDDAPATVLQESYADALRETGISSAAIMVNASNTRPGDPPWRAKWTTDQLAQATRLFEDRGVEPILTAWPRPSEDQVEDMTEALAEMLDAAGVSTLELDAEGNWKDLFLDGFPSLQEAGRTLAGKLRQILPSSGHLELTTYPMHAEFTPAATLSPHMDVLLPQAYSVFQADQAATRWGARFGPGNLQNLAIERARSIPGLSSVTCGLAAYFQDRYPNHSAQDAMSTALAAVSDQGIREVRYWSSKWTIGHRKNPYAQPFIANILKASP